MNIHSNLLGQEAPPDWARFALPVFNRILEATPLGLNYGWSVLVRDCHMKPRPTGVTVARVRSADPGQRRIEILLYPNGGRYTYEIDLFISRNDNFEAIATHLRNGCSAVLAAESQATSPTAPATPATPSENATALAKAVVNVDLDRLTQMRNGLDRLLSAGAELKTVAETKHAAESRLIAAEAEERRLVEESRKLGNELVRWIEETKALADQERDLKAKLAATEAAIQQAESKRKAVEDSKEVVDLALAPAKESAEYARLEVDDALHAEQKHTRALAEGDEMAPLLAALAKLATPR